MKGLVQKSSIIRPQLTVKWFSAKRNFQQHSRLGFREAGILTILGKFLERCIFSQGRSLRTAMKRLGLTPCCGRGGQEVVLFGQTVAWTTQAGNTWRQSHSCPTIIWAADNCKTENSLTPQCHHSLGKPG